VYDSRDAGARTDLRSRPSIRAVRLPDNLKRLSGFRYEVCRAWRQALGRRSQRGKMTWAQFERVSKKYLPLPHRVHPYPPQRFAS
jgi:hypothetical protein